MSKQVAAPQSVLRATSVQGSSGRLRERASRDSWKCVCNAINIGAIQCQNCGLLHNPRTGELVRPSKIHKPLSRSYALFAVIVVAGAICIAVAVARTAPVTSQERQLTPPVAAQPQMTSEDK